MKADLTLEYALSHMLSYVISASLFSEQFHCSITCSKNQTKIHLEFLSVQKSVHGLFLFASIFQPKVSKYEVLPFESRF